jgi:tetratricopeptide (TPR) repeat protein
MSRSFYFFSLTLLLVLAGNVAIAQQMQESYQKAFQTGLDLFEKGLYAEALPYFEEASEGGENIVTTETAEFYKVRALSRIDSSGIDIHVDRFVQAYPESNRAAVLLREVAEDHIERGEYAQAVERMDRALNFPQSYNERAELYYVVAETAAEMGDYALAREYFLALSDDHRRSVWSPRALYARGRLYLEEERFAESSDAFELLRERHPDNCYDAKNRYCFG